MVFELAAKPLGMSKIDEWYAFMCDKTMLDLCCGPIPWEQELQCELLVCYDWLVETYAKNNLIQRGPRRLYIDGPTGCSNRTRVGRPSASWAVNW